MFRGRGDPGDPVRQSPAAVCGCYDEAVVRRWLLLVAVLERATALDPGRAITEYQYDLWPAGTRLACGALYSIAQTPDGYLWLGAERGLVRFNGTDFTLFGPENTGGLVDGKVWDLSLTPRGDLLIVSTAGAGLTRLSRGRFTAAAAGLWPAGTMIRAAIETRAGDLWVGTFSAGLIRIRGNASQRYSSANGLPGDRVKDILEDRNGNVWIASDGGGAFLYADGAFRSPPEGPGPSRKVIGLHEDPGGTLWLATLDRGVVRAGSGPSLFPLSASAPSGLRVLSVCRDRDGNVWAGADGGGLARLTDGRVEYFLPRHGLVSAGVRAVFEDREGSLWLGTDDGSLSRLRDVSHTLYTSRHGLSNDSVRTVFQDPSGVLWAGTANGLNRFDGARFRALPGRLERGIVTTLAGGPDGLWVGTSGTGLWRLRRGRLQSFPHVKDEIISMVATSGRHVWVATQAGSVYCLDPGPGRTLWSAGGLNAATALALDGAVVWVGTNHGLYARTPDGRMVFQGLASRIVTSLLAGNDGLWIGTDRGLYLLGEGRITDFTAAGLPEDYLLQLLDGEPGYLWFSSDRGVYRVPLGALRGYCSGRIRRIEPTALLHIPAAGGSGSGYHQPAGCKDRRGRLWFATVRGLLMVDPARIRFHRTPPPVFVESVAVDGRAVAAAQDLRLAPGAWELTIRFAGLSYIDPARMPFRYRLEGLDRDWVDAAGRRFASYYNLPPGRYRFQVTAANSDGVWNHEGATLWIAKSPHYYQTSWFAAALAAAVLGAAWFAYRRRIASMRRQFSAVLAERNRIARDLHDTLEQGLTGISLQLESLLTRRDLAPHQLRPALELTAHMVRHCLGEAQRAVQDLRSETLERSGLKAALEEVARQFSVSARVRCEVRVEGEVRRLASAIETNLLRVGQESMTNAVKHGKATEIAVLLRFGDRETALSISDNGRGMDTASGESRPHFGLLGMRERANKMGGRLQIESTPGAGARVEIVVPGGALEKHE